jgi:hypothetical protein
MVAVVPLASVATGGNYPDPAVGSGDLSGSGIEAKSRRISFKGMDGQVAHPDAGQRPEGIGTQRCGCREPADLGILDTFDAVDPSRINDPEIASEGERDRLKALAGRYSREDLLRAFDLLARAEADVRAAAQPRYHLEMALLRWIYLRKIVPIEDSYIKGLASASEMRQPKTSILSKISVRFTPSCFYHDQRILLSLQYDKSIRLLYVAYSHIAITESHKV